MSELGNAQVSFNNALGLYKNNNLKEAIEQLNEILNIESSHKKSLDLMVHIYIKINQPINALQFIDRCIRISHDTKKYLELKFKLLIFINDHKNALGTIKELHKQYPSINSTRELSNQYIINDEIDKSEKVVQDFS